MAALDPETPEELAVKTDFRANIWSVFQELYEDKWDQGASSRVAWGCGTTDPVPLTSVARWNSAVGEWTAHSAPCVPLTVRYPHSAIPSGA